MNPDSTDHFASKTNNYERIATNLHGNDRWPSMSALLSYLVVFVILACQAIQYFDLRPPPAILALRRRAFKMLSPRVLLLWEQYYGSFNRALCHVSEGDSLGAIAPAAQTVKKAYGHFSRLTQASARRRSSTAHTNPGNGALPGLGNWDNSCYQNSVLQGLASLRSIPNYLRLVLEESGDGPSEDLNASRPTVNALQMIIDDLNNPEHSGRLLWTPSALKSMSSWQQQDAQEYFSKIVEELDREAMRTVALLRQRSNSGLGIITALEQESQRADMTDKATPPEETTLLHSSKQEVGSSRSVSSQSTPSSSLQNPLEGLLCQRVECLRCGWSEGFSMIPFICLTLPLGRAWKYSLESCLDEYTKSELIEGVECARCTLMAYRRQLEKLLAKTSANQEGVNGEAADEETIRKNLSARLDLVDAAIEEEDFTEEILTKTCKISSRNRVSSTKSRQALIARSPKSLILHINRSVFDEFSGHQMKNHADVDFPRILDLESWCLEFDGQDDERRDDVRRTATANPKPVGSEGAESPFATMYEIKAVITHYGRHENGHYICYRKSPYPLADANAAPQWWRLSDEEVAMVSEDEVLEQGGVFMLFYERVDEADLKPERTAGGPAVLEQATSTPSPRVSAESSLLDAAGASVDATASTEPLEVDEESEDRAAASAPSSVNVEDITKTEDTSQSDNSAPSDHSPSTSCDTSHDALVSPQQRNQTSSPSSSPVATRRIASPTHLSPSRTQPSSSLSPSAGPSPRRGSRKRYRRSTDLNGSPSSSSSSPGKSMGSSSSLVLAN